MSRSPASTPATTVYSDPLNNGNHKEGTEELKGASSDDPTYHALGLSSYLFNAGYMNQQWTDVQIIFFDQSLKLHRIVLSRSPFLAHVMLNYAPGSAIRLQLADDSVTSEAIHITLHHLYCPAQHLVNPTNARAVLAAAYLLEGMPELVHHAYTICKDAIGPTTVADYVHWLDDASQHTEGRRSYGEWSARLEQDIFDYLVRGLPKALSSEAQPVASNPALLSTYAQLPFDLFKLCVEHPSLPITPTQNRFAFAKKAIALRKKAASAAQMEENVVLAVGDEQGTVHVTQRPKRTRTALFKVEGTA